MPNLEFNPVAESMRIAAVEQARILNPEFTTVHRDLEAAGRLVVDEPGVDELTRMVYRARIGRDLGMVDVGVGLYARKYEGMDDTQAAEIATIGLLGVTDAYLLLRRTNKGHAERIRIDRLQPDIDGEFVDVMSAMFQATLTTQLLAGTFGLHKKADSRAIAEQWMLGRGNDDNGPGAWEYAQTAAAGHRTAEIGYLGLRGERANGGLIHLAKGFRQVAERGRPQLQRLQESDPERAKQSRIVAERLARESRTRRGAIDACLDHQRFWF